MYSEEIQAYVNDRNHELDSNEIWYITDTTKHPQIARVLFEDEIYHIWTEDGYHFWFNVKCKVLVK